MLLASFPSAAFAFQDETEETTTAEVPAETEIAETSVESEATETTEMLFVNETTEKTSETEVAETFEEAKVPEADVTAEIPAETEVKTEAETESETETEETGPVTITVSKSTIESSYSGDATVPITNALKEADQNASADRPYIIKVDAGSYTLRYALRLCSFTTLDLTGVTLTQTSSEQNMLRVGSYRDINEAGYCYQDITLIGGVFDQNFTNTVAVKGAHVRNLTIEDVTVKNTVNAHLMEFAGVKGLTIRGCTLDNQKIDKNHLYYEAIQLDILVPAHYNNYAFEALPNSDVLVENCTFTNVPRGFGSHTAILNEPVNGVTVKGCSFTGCDSAAIQGMNWNHVVISDNTITGCARAIALYPILDDGLAAYPISYFSTIDSVTSEDTSAASSKYAEKTSTNSDILIENNTITVSGDDPYAKYKKVAICLQGKQLNSTAPIHSEDDSGGIPAGNYYITNAIIRDNTIKSEGDGLRLVNAKNMTISGNTVNTAPVTGDTTAYYGIQLYEKASAAEISGNTINKGPTNGIMINENSSAKKVQGNRILSPGKYGISVEGTTVDEISNNTIETPAVNGIMVSFSGKAGLIQDNTIKSPKKRGINIEASTSGDIKNNKISSPVDNGIFVYNGGKAGNIVGNTISSPGKYGISVSTNSTAKQINGNRITDSASAAIQIISSSTAERITANSINKTGSHSIIIDKSSTVSYITNNSISVPGDFYGIAVINGSKVQSLKNNKVRSAKGYAYSISKDSSTSSSADELKTNTVTSSATANLTRLVLNKTSPVEMKTSVSSSKPSTLQITATIANADSADTKATWKSDNTSVATVDSTGKVTAWKYGKTTITATADNNSGVKASCTIQTRFYDVNDSGKYYYKPVYWAADAGITTGYNKVYFGPERNCERRELMIFLWRLKGSPVKSSYPDPTKQFNDMGEYAPSSAAYKAVAWAVATGITKGYADGGFHPTDSVTRKDTLIFLYRAAGKPKVSGTITFPDVLDLGLSKTSDTYRAILWGSSIGITNGYSDGNFQPMTNCLREHIVTFLYRYHTKVK